MTGMSLLQKKRSAYKPRVPLLLKELNSVHFKEVEEEKTLSDSLRLYFPHTLDQNSYCLQKGEKISTNPLTVGVLFSGGQAAGGHNVIAALFDGLKIINQESQLIGFLGGIDGILKNSHKTLFEKEIDLFRNQGGFDLIGTGRGKLESEKDLDVTLKRCRDLDLDGLVIIGGDDSNTNAAILAEYFLANGCKTKVVGVPKTIDGDLRSKDIEISFGFDSACKTYSEMIGNIARDAISSKKYYHFIKLMGRSASHICLECALTVQPNLALIGEEKKSLKQITEEIADLIFLRSEQGKEYGVILIPEGLIEFIPEFQLLIKELSEFAEEKTSSLIDFVSSHLKEPHKSLFFSLPEKIQKQLLFDRDPHGNIKVSQIDTEQLIIDKVTEELKTKTEYRGKWTPQRHFLGYEGRSCFPSNFDANYAYSLGLIAVLAIRDQLTGVICSLQNLTHSVDDWQIKALPIVQLMHFEIRKGKEKPVVKKHLINTKEKAFLYFDDLRKSWKIDDCYRYPGPIQFFGDLFLTDSTPCILNFKEKPTP